MEEDQKAPSESAFAPERGAWASDDDSWRRPRQCRSVAAASSRPSGSPDGSVSHAESVPQSQKIWLWVKCRIRGESMRSGSILVRSRLKRCISAYLERPNLSCKCSYRATLSPTNLPGQLSRLLLQRSQMIHRPCTSQASLVPDLSSGIARPDCPRNLQLQSYSTSYGTPCA
jgi:hypothetical protein